jgi:hypothetical protein
MYGMVKYVNDGPLLVRETDVLERRSLEHTTTESEPVRRTI